MRGDDVGIYSIKKVSELTGLSVTTLRSWESTYGVVVPTRTAGGHRLYSRDDIERLRWLKSKMDEEGLPAAAAHRLLSEQVGKIGVIAERATKRGAIVILVAEKDPITAELEEYFLEKEGFDVHVVLDGRIAVQEVERVQPDLVILDVILPGLSGLDVCRTLKTLPNTAHIPVLIFSVLDVRDRALGAGADAFLLKPIEQPKLIGSVKSLLTESRRNRKDVR